MKKINLLIAITSLFTFSCSSDDEGGNENSSNNLIGTYTIESIITSEQIDTNGDGTLDPVDVTNVFNCNGLIIIQEETMSYRETFLDVFNNGNEVIAQCVTNPDDQGSYTSNNTGLIFTTTDFNGDPETISFQINDGNIIFVQEVFTDNGAVNATITYSR